MPDDLTLSCMIALPLSQASAQALEIRYLHEEPEDSADPYEAIPVNVDYYEFGGYSPADVRLVPWWDYHVTLVWIPKLAFRDIDNVISAVEKVAASSPPAVGRTAGSGQFHYGEDGYPCVALVDTRDASPLRERILRALPPSVEVSTSHGFIPHITLAYSWMKDALSYEVPEMDLAFGEILIKMGSSTAMGEGREYRVRLEGGLGKTLESVPGAFVAESADAANADDVPLSVTTRENRDMTEATLTKAVWSAAYVNDLPDSAFLYIESGGEKDSEGKTTPRSLRHFPVKGDDGKVDLPHVRNAIARIPQSNAPGLTAAKKESLQERARNMLGSEKSLDEIPVPEIIETEKEGKRMSSGMLSKLSAAFDTIKEVMGWAKYDDGDDEDDMEDMMEDMDEKSQSFFILKDADGIDRWVSWSSNGFKDREGEIVSTQALINEVARADKDGDRGTLRLWHTPGTDFGVCDQQVVSGRFLIETGTFYEDDFSQAVKASLMSYADEPLGTSIGFYHQLGDELDGVYDSARIIERSVCPLRVAANPFTSFQLLKGDALMDEAKKAWFETMLGNERTSQIISRAAEATKDLEGLHAFKALVEPEAPAEETAKAADEAAVEVIELTDAQSALLEAMFSKTMEPVVNGLRAIDAVLKTVMEGSAEKESSRDEQLKAIIDRLDAIEQVVETKTGHAPKQATVFRATSAAENLLDPERAKDLLNVTEQPPAAPVTPYINDLLVGAGLAGRGS